MIPKIGKYSRLHYDDMYMIQAVVVALSGSCVRRKTGCILVDDKRHVLSTGRNGRHSGAIECLISPCKGATAPSGQNLSSCEAIHAEENALLQCSDIGKIHTAYVTASPCDRCISLLLNTSCERIVFLEQYPHTKSEKKWLAANRIWEGPYTFKSNINSMDLIKLIKPEINHIS